MKSSSETLKDALIRVGDGHYADLLSPEAQKLTKAKITDFMNSKSTHTFSTETVKSLRKFAKQRMKDGKSIFPYEKMEGIQHNDADDHMGGGTW
ncbi:hypothetical protein HNV11_12375 [Spirosoma taeanense]|uniref:Uncharacterized protein n=1 Tax=Spirosoma taeanense TaxID=2735870 RepID=A0A6M5Y857_9BACT|nr:hypothetical protein [Spirosoma taeanense]QJW90115.1 hypothetical protein HNV11_12375 [Spirosoma taeanense]